MIGAVIEKATKKSLPEAVARARASAARHGGHRLCDVGGGTYTNKLIALFTLDQDGKVFCYDEYFDPRAFDSVTSSSQADGHTTR